MRTAMGQDLDAMKTALADTAEVQESRYIGSSSAPAATALVCAPDGD